MSTTIVVSTLKVDITHLHCRIHVWNRGAKAGTLIVEPEDTDHFISVLSTSGTLVFYKKFFHMDYNSYQPLCSSVTDIFAKEEKRRRKVEG
jgi:hypothetical protein